MIWEKYEKGKNYISRLNLIAKTEKFWDFYLGNQWRSTGTKDENLPVMNFIKGVIKYKVAVVSQNKMAARYIDPEGREEFADICEALNKNFEKVWENGKFNTKAWNVVKNASIQGDSYIFWGSDDATETQIIQNTNILLGDEQNSNLQEQPYIIIVERILVSEAKRRAKANGIPQSEIDLIVPDEDKTLVIGNKQEVDDSSKCISLLYMDKDEDGYVRVGRATKTCVYEPVEPLTKKDAKGNVVGGLKSYPIVNYVWEDAPSNARGRGEVEQLLPNQLELNKTLARRAVAVKQTAFPRLAYDRTSIENPEDLDKVGVAIGLNGGNAQSVNQMISYLNASSMSSDAQYLFNDLLTLSKDLAGAGDAATGNINPERASGEAINAVKDAQQLPLNEQVAKFNQFVNDIARVELDIWFAYNEEVTISYSEDGEAVTRTITQKDIDELRPEIRIDVSSDSPWSKQAEQSWLDNLFQSGQITLEEYVEIAPENSYVPKAKMKTILQKREMQQQAMQQEMMQQQMPQEMPVDIPLQGTELTSDGQIPQEDITIPDEEIDEDLLAETLIAEAEAAEWQNTRSPRDEAEEIDEEIPTDEIDEEVLEILQECLRRGLIDEEDYDRALEEGVSEETLAYLKELLNQQAQ